ncbi:mandelate racemase/muconate lactonizing enzyme family protein [[Actinomadura] parvosata subsp. kistnae]|uniref:Mandelate racemase/muconate lactonizing protein n=1 Tax=[Actinomadura] parvosata subsp. kistnae TaxID=1909395 RepID=A0A1V0A345_9ACTN|nr:mandelate racemase/muconate lactonizing enzyme family protein [Nonomuraea sp. ATCC 55076]AQZ64635.1 mandelate racemase/muconate lactonizing protein [Nonomuraea sp. ATCC 55076]SPL99525.1 mandelate racemase/muconate lactonizing enzyme family protein [Actinomadura parvosata subsp. kistnae]
MRVQSVRFGRHAVPLARPVSDAKVATGRQRPLSRIDVLTCEITTADGIAGLGFSYTTRAGTPAQFAHVKEVGELLLGEDPADIGRLYDRLLWAGASVGRSGVATQALAAIDVALWDLKAKRAGLPLAKLLGAYRDSVRVYNTSGGYLQAPIEEVTEKATQSLAGGIGGIKIKVGQPAMAEDLRRLTAVREHIGDGVPLMVDANQQWDRPSALRFGRAVEEFGLVWIEEPLDAYDAEGHAQLAAALDTPIATGEMLSSIPDLVRLIDLRAVDYLQPDVPRVGGITPYLKVAALADHARLQVAPHFVMEIHVHLAAACPRDSWVEHIEWLSPLFEERLEIADGRIAVPDRPGLGLSLAGRARDWRLDQVEFHLNGR